METGFLTRTLADGGTPRRYQVYVPADYAPDRRWPVILFLHGAGEGGTDGLLPTEYQLGSAIRRRAADYPGLVVFPQVPTYQPVWTSRDVEWAMTVLDAVMHDFATDGNRVYVTGVSTGARAAWHAMYRWPDRFAAGLVVCGVVRPRLPGGRLVPDPDPVVPEADGDPVPALATRLHDTPLWIFHGDDDPVFPVSETRELVEALAGQGAPVRYTELAGFGHDVWDVAYYSPDVATWLFSQDRRSDPR